MSIIADTLNRLQTRSPNSEASQGEPAPEATTSPAPRPCSHTKIQSSKQVFIVTLGLILGLGSIGLAGFWIGWNFDFGLPALSSNLPETEPVELSTFETLPKPSAGQSWEDPGYPEPTDILSDSSLPPIKETLPGETVASIEAIPTNQTQSAVQALPVPPLHQPPTEADRTNSGPIPPSTGPQPSPVVPTMAQASPPPAMVAEKPAGTTDSPADQAPGRPVVNEPSDPMSLSANTLPVPVEDEPSPTTFTATLDEEPVLVEDLLVTQSEHTEPTPSPDQHPKDPQKNPSPAPQITPLSATPSPVHTRNALQQAKAFIRAGQYEEALGVLSSFFDPPPTDWEPWFWMGTAYLGNGQLDQADQYFLSGLARNDKVPQLWIQRALVAQQHGEYQLAVHELRQAESLQPDLPHIHLNMGYAYDQLGNNRLANQYYGKFMQLTEGKPEFFSTRKKLLARLTQASSSTHSSIR